jgi:hypothetical protein
MKETVIAHIRKPTDEELKRMRELWGALKQKSVPASTAIGVELQTYLQHAIRMVGLVAGLHPLTSEPVVAGPYPLRVSEDGVARLHDAVRLWSAVLALWTIDGLAFPESPNGG